MPWPKGKHYSAEHIAKRIATFKARGKKRRKSITINGIPHWRCSTCLGWFDSSGFFTTGKQLSGLTSQCRCCHGAASLRTRDADRARETNREHMRRARQRSPETFRKRDREAARYRGITEQTKARTALNAAVKRGDIKRPKNCHRCRVACKPNGHHRDYSKPLEVEWLCTVCHGKEHRKFKRAIELKRVDA